MLKYPGKVFSREDIFRDFDFGDIFSGFGSQSGFSGGGGMPDLETFLSGHGFGGPHPRKGRDVRQDFYISFEEAALGTTRTVIIELKGNKIKTNLHNFVKKKYNLDVDNVKYEKIQFSDSYGQTADTVTYHKQYLFDMYDREPTGRWVVEICGEVLNEFGFECIQIFQSRTSIVWLEVGDVTTVNWTILKKIN